MSEPDLNDREELENQIKLFMDKAERSITASKQLMESEHFDFASSRLYYGVFYAMEAVLLTKNISSSRHSGVISEFNLHFVKSGIFPKNFSKIIGRLFRERQAGDYGIYSDVDEGETNKNLELAENFIKKVKEYLSKESYL